MRYRVEIAASAKADIHQAARWLSEQASPAAATHWLAGLDKAISTLERQPRRCPVAAESHKFPVEIRELLYGRSKTSKHRILFMMETDVVRILYVRHSARDELEP
jgi:plasmid stabilization system protein ParE